MCYLESLNSRTEIRCHRLNAIAWIATATFAASGLANDTFVHESAGNLMFARNNQVEIAKERLVGPPVRSLPNPVWGIPIHVEYELRNTTGRGVEARIGFPLAACSLGDYIQAKHLDFLSGSAATCVKDPKMSLSVDGRQTTGQWDFVFLRDGAALRDGASDINLGKRISALINLVKDPERKFYVEDIEFLNAAKSLCDELGGTINGPDCTAFGRIAVHRTFLWTHAFAPGATVHVVHDYQVTASWNLHPDEVFHSDVFCVGNSTSRSAWNQYLENLKHEEAEQRFEGVYPREFFTEYVLRTGALWAGPIRDFDLLIRKSSPDQLVSTCFSGLVKTSPTEFRARRIDFSPSEDLRVLYLPLAKLP